MRKNITFTKTGGLLLMAFFCLVSGRSAAQAYIEPARKLQTALFAINTFYVDTVDNDVLVDDAMKAMVKTLDPHSAYMSKEEVKEMNEPLEGGFNGVGISFNMMNDTLFVIEVIAGGPSEKVGMLAGDRIVKVDGETIAGVKMTNKEVMKRLRGPKGTVVNVSAVRRGVKDTIEFRIVRDKIPLYSVDASFMVNKNTGYIRISRFAATTLDEYEKAFRKLKSKGMKNLIIDLQSNGGGYMQTAVNLADEFLPKDRCIVYTKGIHSPRSQANATAKGDFESGNLILLIDEYSASSSEILSGAIQDWDRGLIIGRRSFGKGLVQRMLPLGDGTVLKLTIARYYTPSGRCIQKPYDNGREAYSEDLIDRYNRGEMESADSIHFPDSLRYQTLLKKRTVYGGGGIMPDVFVPMDTSRYTDLYKVLTNKGVIYKFVLQYTDLHRKALLKEYPSADKFVRKFEMTEEMVDSLFALSEKENVKVTDEQRESDLTVLKLQSKAYLARDLYDSGDYYKVMVSENDALQKALQILSDKKLRDRYGLK